jgi:hypothetical protein
LADELALLVNLNEIKEAKAPDVLVQANDVIDVTYSAVKILGCALHNAAQESLPLRRQLS